MPSTPFKQAGSFKTSFNSKSKRASLENFEYSVFSPKQSMNKVLVSQAQPIKGKLINQNLESDESIEHFLDSNTMLQSSL
jgi:hypothetical protein